MATIFTPDKFLDLFRYYEEAESINTDSSIKTIYENYMEASSDFIYYLTFYIFRILHIPIHLVNGLYVTLFYYGAFSILEQYANRCSDNILDSDMKMTMTAMVFAMPVMFVFSIARMTASFAFIFLSITFLLKKERIVAIIFLLLSLYTHTGAMIYVAYLGIATSISFLISKIKIINNHNFFGVLIISLALIFLLEKGISLILQLPFFSTYHYFALYLEDMGLATFYGLGGITTVTLLFYYICCLYFVMRSDLQFPFKVAVYMMPFLIMSFFMSDMFLQRMSMYSIPFWGVLMLNSLRYNHRLSMVLTAIAVFLGVSCIIATNRFYL